MSKNTYITLCSESGEGAYGFGWYRALQVKKNGSRFRYLAGGFSWSGNQGGMCHSKPLYMDRAKGREILRLIRTLRIADAKGEAPHDITPIACALGDY